MITEKSQFKTGFTLIEVMIAITLFSAIMILGTGAVLNSSSVHKKTQTMRAVMDNLNFVMEDMSRNLRLGSDYVCISGSLNNCSAISFTSVDGSNITYGIMQNGTIEKNAIPITPPEVTISPSSGFSIDNTAQPLVTIRLVGTVVYKGGQTNLNLRTSVSQRALVTP